MSSRESVEIRTMRVMAWERAKGELRSVAQTYWDSAGDFEKFDKLMEQFISAVEDEGIQE